MPMNRDSTDRQGADGAPSFDLAHEAPFGLNHVTVTPSALSLATAGWTTRLEPRVMQVLVVLARAAPVVVGRGELNARVWGGRVVGDDAINRAIQTLRRIAAEAPPPLPFRIETVPRVGYRLTATSADTPDAAPDPRAGARVPEAVARDASAPPRPSPRRRAIGLALGAAAALGIVVAVAAWQAADTRVAEPAAWRIAGTVALGDLPPGAQDVTISPDGIRLAYRGQGPNGRDRVFVRAFRDGGAGVAVSPAAIDARRPAWSPDGASLAFAAYDAGRPCGLYVLAPARPQPALVGSCETVRDPRLAWSADGRALLFGDASGENAVQRIGASRLADGHRIVLSNPPGDSMGDALPIARGNELVFQRQYGWADEGWIARNLTTGNERLLWRRSGVAGSVAAPLPDGAVAVAWTRAGASGLDIVDARGRASAQPIALGPVTAMSSAGDRLLVESDRSESELVRAEGGGASKSSLIAVRGRMFAPVLLPDGRLRFPVAAAGVARIWQRDTAGAARPWGTLVAAKIAGLALSPDGRLTAALVTGNAGREIVVLDAEGQPLYRWNPHARSLNAAAWSGDGRQLIVPVLDGSGWRLVALDPLGRTPPRDLEIPGFAVVISEHSALYAVRAGESTGIRELWRLDGRRRRLPIDLTLYDIVNWRAVAGGIWLPDRSVRDRPRLVLREAETGRIVRSVAAPGLAGAGSGLAADDHGPVYVKVARDAPEYGLVTLVKTDRR